MENRSWWKFSGKLLGNGLLILVVCLIFMGLLAPIMQYTIGMIAAQLLNMLFFYGMLYSIAHSEGRKEFNKVKYCHIQKDLWWGVKCGTLMMAVLYLPYLALLVCRFVFHSNIGVTIYKICSPHLFAVVSAMIPSAQIDDISVGMMILLAVLPLTVLLATGIGYILGYKRISVIERLIYIKRK